MSGKHIKIIVWLMFLYDWYNKYISTIPINKNVGVIKLSDWIGGFYHLW